MKYLSKIKLNGKAESLNDQAMKMIVGGGYGICMVKCGNGSNKECYQPYGNCYDMISDCCGGAGGACSGDCRYD